MQRGDVDDDAATTTVRLRRVDRDELKLAAARRRVTMVDLLAELIATLPEGADPPRRRRRKPESLSA